ncbi:SEL1-like repeat protein [Photobacterium leiognathi]|uniref:SEL1-like repeat protein n=1 Tax=Photobacterium leiognathi TaxID=553611 RepID=UPI0027375674|nr:tetratricopeptide repeat protein [Photobacterium leiognathi]
MVVCTLDIENKIKRFQRAAELGNSDAMFNLAIIYMDGQAVEQSDEKAIEYFQRAAVLGNSDAMFNLAIIYMNGQGAEQSDEKAIEYFQRAAENGNSDAMFNLAISYMDGQGVEQSDEKAIEYYQRAAELGNSEAMFNLSVCYKEGYGVVKSDEKAVEYYREAANAGHDRAMFNLALSYRLGLGVEQSDEEAVKYYQQAADAGNSNAMFNLAVCYKHGYGVIQSDKKAVKYYQQAADAGNNSAIFNLATSYKLGQGVERSDEIAVKYYKEGVELGDGRAMFCLALCYKFGEGCEKAHTISERMFRQAYDNGYNEALRYLPHPSLSKYVYPALEEHHADRVEEVKQAFSEFQDAIIEVMKSHLYTERKAVYHFTRWCAIESILPKVKSVDSKNVIRLYHEDYMNDPDEGRSLLSLIEQGKLAAEYQNVADFMARVLNQRSTLTQDAATYMASFTMESDRLDLWRAYGSDGDGFCLKIDIEQTDTHIWSQGKFDTEACIDEEQEQIYLYKLYRVEYEEDKKKEKLEKLLIALTPLFEITGTLNKKVKEEIQKTLFYMLGEIVYLFKDAQYSSEKEVRMFQRLSLDQVSIDESDIGKLYQPTGPILFMGDNSEIMIGPKVCNRRAVELSLRKRLQINGFHKTNVTHSSVKYR